MYRVRERNIREYIRQQLLTGDDCITYVDNVGRIWLNNAKNFTEKNDVVYQREVSDSGTAELIIAK